MPSKTQAQHRLMQAVAHGFKPTQFKGPPVSVAHDFVEADKKAGRVKSHPAARPRKSER